MKYRDLGKVIKSPLDTNDYKVIELCSNRLKAFIISSPHPSPNTQKINSGNLGQQPSVYFEIQNFNSKYLDIEPATSAAVQNDKEDICNPTENQPPEKKPKTTISKSNETKHDEAPRLNKTSVALVIGSGMINDPIGSPGLAHFVEHCVFLGSEKYPQKEGLTNFCQDNDGDTNAGTTAHSTSFRLTIDSSNLDQALKRLYDLISKPLFNTNDVVQEIEALDSEFHMSKVNDDHRYLALLLSFFVDHPLGRLGIGSRQTFDSRKDLHKRLWNWKEANYRPSNMVIGIEGPFTVDGLADLVFKHFSTLENDISTGSHENQNILKTVKEIPVDPGKWNVMTHLIPITFDKWTKLAWILPAGVIRAYQIKPLQFISHLLENKLPGGLDHFLRNKGWLITLFTSSPNLGYFSTKFVTIFVISLRLTTNGFKNRLEVIKYVFSYLRKLEQSKDSDLKNKFDTLKQSNADTFHYASDKGITDPNPENNLDNILKKSESLQDFAYHLLDGVNPPEILTSQFLTSHFCPELIKKCLQLMTPRAVNIVVEAHEFESKCTMEERYFKSKYLTEKLDPQFLKELETVSVWPEFLLPLQNGPIQKTFIDPVDVTNTFTKDTVIFKDSRLSIFYSQGIQNYHCHLPAATYEIHFASPRAMNSAENGLTSIMELWGKSFTYLVDTKLRNPLISMSIKGDSRLSCVINGPSNQLPDLLDLVVNLFSGFETYLKECNFESMTESQIDISNNELLNSSRFATILMNSVVKQQFFMPWDAIQFLKCVTANQMVKFTQAFKQNMFVSVDIRGCVGQSDGNRIVKTIQAMTYAPWDVKLTTGCVQLNRAMELPVGERCFRVKSHNKYDNNHMVLNHYQLGLGDDKSCKILEAMISSMEGVAFEQLRTVKHLGYSGEVESESYHSVTGLTVRVNAVADQFSTQYVDEQIDSFLLYFYQEIISKRANYKKKIDDFLEGDEIKWMDVNGFYSQYFLPRGAGFRKLSVQIEASPANCRSRPRPGEFLEEKIKKYSSGVAIKKHEQGSSSSPMSLSRLSLPKVVKEENGYFVTDFMKFKSSMPCYPNPEDLNNLLQ